MVSVSNSLEERTINFKSRPVIDLTDDWILNGSGGYISDDEITIPSMSSATVTKRVNKYCSYLKIMTNITSQTQVSTMNGHKVSVVVQVNYTKSSVKDTTEIFYPAFDYEDIKDNYVIVELSGDKVKNVKVTIFNVEDQQVTVDDFGLFISVKLNDTNLPETIAEDADTQAAIDQVVQDGIDNGDITLPAQSLLIPLSPTAPLPPDPTQYAAGTIFRLQ